jgi:regulator of replication initiation timing
LFQKIAGEEPSSDKPDSESENDLASLRDQLMVAVTAVKSMQAEKVAMVKQLRKLNTENKRLKQIVGELRLTTNQSEVSELRALNNSSRFMLSQRKEVRKADLSSSRVRKVLKTDLSDFVAEDNNDFSMLKITPLPEESSPPIQV